MNEIPNLSVVDFLRELEESNNAVLIDARKPHEVAQGALKGAIVIDFLGEDFQRRIQALDKTKHYFVYCRSGRRSMNTCFAMQAIGIKNTSNLDGGYLALQDIENHQEHY